MKKSITARLLALLTAAMLTLSGAGAMADTAETAPVTEETAVTDTVADDADEKADDGEPVAEADDDELSAEAPADDEASGEEPEADATAEPGTEENQDTRPAVSADVVALVGDSPITAAEAAEWYSYVLEMYSYYGYDVTDAEIDAQLRDITLDALVNNYVQMQMWTELGFDQFTAEELAQMTDECQATYDATYKSVYDGFDDGNTGKSTLHEKTMAELELYGYTVEALLDAAKEETAYSRLYEHLTAGIEVTDEDVKASYANTVAVDKMIYENDPAGYVLQCMYGTRPVYAPEGIRTVKHILIKYDDDDTQKISELTAMAIKPDDYAEQYAAAKQAAYEGIKDTIDEIMAKLSAGESFDALVEEYGEDPGMKSEPYKSEGYMVYEGCTNLVAEFVESGMALKNIGDVTEMPALTTYGAHIMLYHSDLPAGEAELTAEQAEAMRIELLSSLQNQAYNEGIEGYRAKLGEVYTYPENLITESAGSIEADAAAAE